MSNVRDDSSSEPRARAAGAAESPPYARLRRRAPRAGPMPAPPTIDLRTLDGTGATPWNELLDWALAAAGAEAGFVLGAEGLTVAARGTAVESESIGPRLMIALDQARALVAEGERVCGVQVDLGGRWLTGLCLQTATAGRLTLGLVGSAAVSRDARVAIEGAFVRALGD